MVFPYWKIVLHTMNIFVEGFYDGGWSYFNSLALHWWCQMAVLWSWLCSTEEAISYWLPCLVNQFEIEYEARKTLIIGMVMIFMHDHHDIDDHHDDKQGTLWFLSSTLVRCKPAQSFIQFWGENCSRLLRLGAIDDYQTPSNISPPCHLWREVIGERRLIFKRSKKTLIFYIFKSAFI